MRARGRAAPSGRRRYPLVNARRLGEVVALDCPPWTCDTSVGFGHHLAAATWSPSTTTALPSSLLCKGDVHADGSGMQGPDL